MEVSISNDQISCIAECYILCYCCAVTTMAVIVLNIIYNFRQKMTMNYGDFQSLNAALGSGLMTLFFRIQVDLYVDVSSFI